MKQEDFKHFKNDYIDDISSDIENNYFSPVWEEILEEYQFDEILDIGCGNGVFTANLKKENNCKLYGVDGSTYALKEAQKNGYDEVYKIDDFCVDELPFENDRFKMVVCKDVLEHLIDPEKLITEIKRIVKPGANILIHVPNHFTLKGKIKFLFTNNIDPYNFFPSSNNWNNPHIRFFTYKDMISLFAKNQFKLVKNLSHNFSSLPYYPGRIRHLIPFKEKIEKYLSNKYPTQFAKGITVLFVKDIK